MPVSPLAVLVVLALLAGTATAQPHLALPSLGVRRIEVFAESPEPSTDPSVKPKKSPEVQISPGISTTLEFNAAIAQDKVIVEGAERFSLVDIGRYTLRLVPSEEVQSGDRFKVSVRFQGGDAPTSAAIVLVAHLAQAERLVEVWRTPRTVESYQQEVKEVRAEVQQCRDENARLRTEHGGPGGLAGLLASNVMVGKEGVVTDRLRTEQEVRLRPGSARRINRAWSYRSATRVAVEIRLENPGAETPWLAAGASLVSRTGVSLNILEVWKQLATPSGDTVRVVVEAAATPQEAQGTFTFKVWEAGGQRSITLTNVTFPR